MFPAWFQVAFRLFIGAVFVVAVLSAVIGTVFVVCGARTFREEDEIEADMREGRL